MRSGEAQVWFVFLSEVDEDETGLDAHETKRAARFVREPDRWRYRRSHVALRRILGGCLNLAPAGIEFRIGENGKPALADHRIEFSLSHSGEMALVGVAAESIGADIEQVRAGVGYAEIAVRLGMIDPATELTPAAFFRAWTRREASGKAAGGGLLASAAELAAYPSVDLEAPAGYAAAVALPATTLSRIVVHRYPHR